MMDALFHPGSMGTLASSSEVLGESSSVHSSQLIVDENSVEVEASFDQEPVAAIPAHGDEVLIIPGYQGGSSSYSDGSAEFTYYQNCISSTTNHASSSMGTAAQFNMFRGVDGVSMPAAPYSIYQQHAPMKTPHLLGHEGEGEAVRSSDHTPTIINPIPIYLGNPSRTETFTSQPFRLNIFPPPCTGPLPMDVNTSVVDSVNIADYHSHHQVLNIQAIPDNSHSYLPYSPPLDLAQDSGSHTHTDLNYRYSHTNAAMSLMSPKSRDFLSPLLLPHRSGDAGEIECGSGVAGSDDDDEENLDADRLVPTIGEIVNGHEQVLDESLRAQMCMPPFSQQHDNTSFEALSCPRIPDVARAGSDPILVEASDNNNLQKYPNAEEPELSTGHDLFVSASPSLTDHAGCDASSLSTVEQDSLPQLSLDLQEIINQMNMDTPNLSMDQLISEDNSNGERRWKCMWCDAKSFTSKPNLIVHLMSHVGIKPHKCPICAKVFKQLSHLTSHIRTHTGARPYVCDICGRAFTQSTHLRRHHVTHVAKKPYICDICSRGFAYPSELRAHVDKHSKTPAEGSAGKDRPLSCSQCLKSFLYPCQLRSHMLSHTGQRDHECAVCGAQFLKAQHLRMHMHTHSEKKAFSCHICNKSFTLKANMMRHKATHVATKSWICHICDKAFGQLQVLRAHMVVHTEQKPFKCELCGKGFCRLINLTAHMSLHNQNKPFQCEVCAASFTLKGNLVRHLKRKHATKVMEPSEEVDGTLQDVSKEKAAPKAGPTRQSSDMMLMLPKKKMSLQWQDNDESEPSRSKIITRQSKCDDETSYKTKSKLERYKLERTMSGSKSGLQMIISHPEAKPVKKRFRTDRDGQ